MVLPRHLNHFGRLMGGTMLQWVDEAAWCAARLEFPDCDFMTVGLDRAAFHHPVSPGALLCFEVERQARGRTSVSYAVRVSCDRPDAPPVFTTGISLVRVDPQGQKLPLPD
jgi:acyl-CoA hydrolase